MSTTPVPVHAPASWTVQQLNQLIVGEEAKFGPLIGIDHDTATSVLIFDFNQPTPPVNAVLALQVGGKPNVPAGTALVCQGTVFVSGGLQLAAATR